jgi:hypothetical protein
MQSLASPMSFRLWRGRRQIKRRTPSTFEAAFDLAADEMSEKQAALSLAQSADLHRLVRFACVVGRVVPRRRN